MEEDQILVMMMEMEVDLPLPHQKTLHQQEEGTGGPSLSFTAGTSWASGQVGQPGQTGRDGRDGQAPQLTKALKDALKTQKTGWDTTNLENS